MDFIVILHSGGQCGRRIDLALSVVMQTESSGCSPQDIGSIS
jgi:hypothetical protein